MANNETITPNHPIYWFEDGSLIIDVHIQRFRVHRTLLTRHSRYLSGITSGGASDCMHTVVKLHAQVDAKDVEALLQHLYHDVPLTPKSTFSRVVSILRVSGPQQLDFPHLHLVSREILENMFLDAPMAFKHDYPLHDALTLASEYKFSTIRKATLYTIVTATEFDTSDKATLDLPSAQSQIPNGTLDSAPLQAEQRSQAADSGRLLLSKSDTEICMTLMTRLIDHFTPILFTVPPASHMDCTDNLAEVWMRLVIQAAIETDEVYKPLEALERIKAIDWETQGLCSSCVAQKREEWTEEQRVIWRLMDDWIGVQKT